MAKITRKIAKIFGSSAGVNQIGTFGSLAAGSPAYTTDPTVIQSLANYLTGWFGAVVGGNSPAIEDMNALCYLFAYQIAYVMQEGVPEWDATTTYYIGSLVNNGSGVIYVSLTDTNLNNALTDATKWRVSNPDKAGAIYTAIVGSSLQVAAGIAQYTSIQTAQNALSSGDSMYILPGTYTENVTINKQLTISGGGKASNLNGTLTLDTGASYCLIRGIRMAQNIVFNALTVGNMLEQSFIATGKTITDNGTANYVLMIQEA